MTVEIENGCKKATDSSERGISSQPIDLGSRQRRGPNWREVKALDRIQGNSNRKYEGEEIDHESIKICSFFAQTVTVSSRRSQW